MEKKITSKVLMRPSLRVSCISTYGFRAFLSELYWATGDEKDERFFRGPATENGSGLETSRQGRSWESNHIKKEKYRSRSKRVCVCVCVFNGYMRK